MKGFPNQVAKLPKLALGMRDIVRLVDAGENVKDDGVLGEALLISGVAGRGHTKTRTQIDEYLRQQRTKPQVGQSFRMTARGLRRLARLMGFVGDQNGRIELTDLGRQAAGFAERPMNQDQASPVIRSNSAWESFFASSAKAHLGLLIPGRWPTRRGSTPYGGEVRAPRTSRRVTPETIAQAGADGFDEVQIPQNVDPQAIAAAINTRLDRLRRHNEIVRDLARRLIGAEIHEDPFDILAIIQAVGILVEVKTLDGTASDQRDRVMGALSQLLYYEAFVTQPVAGEAPIHKIACFEGAISDDHRAFLNSNGIGVIWKVDEGFAGDELATAVMRRYFQQVL